MKRGRFCGTPANFAFTCRQSGIYFFVANAFIVIIENKLDDSGRDVV